MSFRRSHFRFPALFEKLANLHVQLLDRALLLCHCVVELPDLAGLLCNGRVHLTKRAIFTRVPALWRTIRLNRYLTTLALVDGGENQWLAFACRLLNGAGEGFQIADRLLVRGNHDVVQFDPCFGGGATIDDSGDHDSGPFGET